MIYTTKFLLIYQDDNCMDYDHFCQAMFDIQRKIRTFCNIASSEQFSIMMRQQQFKEENGRYPTDEELLGYKQRNHFYHMATEYIPELNTGNASCVSEDVCKYFKNHRKEIIAGIETIPSYKSNQPVIVHNQSITFENDGENIYLTLSLFSKTAKGAYGLDSQRCKFKVWHKSKSSIPIIQRCISGEYKVCVSHMNYVPNKKMWEFALSYQFDVTPTLLDKEKILGLDLGIEVPIVVAISGEEKRWFFSRNEIDAFRRKTEEMRRQISKARVYAGNGSVGHGRETRTKAVDRIGNRISNFRNTKNNAWAREIVNIALKNGCGTIQIENLSGIASGKQSKYLKNWTYYDLQQKIRYKAEAVGISVTIIDPHYTSRRCSCCGYIHENNRPERSEFICQECGYEAHADYNAARNIAVKDIEMIIKMKCEGEAHIKVA